jgi:hypothetical protein
MGSIAAVTFIVAAAIAGIYTGTKPTVINGKAMAARIFDAARSKGLTKVTCTDAPITPEGVTYTCKLWANDGSTAVFDYTWGRSGPKKDPRMIDSTPPTVDRPRKGWDD